MLLVSNPAYKYLITDSPVEGLDPLVALIKLFNYGVGDSSPQGGHRSGLGNLMINATLNNVLAPSDPNWSARVNGLASTKGRTDRNKELGRKRAERVRDHLIEWGVETVRFRGPVRWLGREYLSLGLSSWSSSSAPL